MAAKRTEHEIPEEFLGAHKAIVTRLGRSGALLERMGVSYESFLRTMVHALVASKKGAKKGRKTLADCTPDSLDLAIVKCLNSGLVPDGEEVILTPRNGKDANGKPVTTCELMVGIVGKLKQAYRANRGLELWARTVWEADEWVHVEGLEPRLDHKPARTGGRKSQDVVCVYACARLPGMQRPVWEVLYRPDIDRHRAFSNAANGPAWKDSYHEMAERSAIGLVLKRLPKRADDMRQAFDPLPDEGPFEAAEAAPALEHLPSRTLTDVMPAAQPERAAVAARPEPAPAVREQPPVDAYEGLEDSPF